MHSSTNTQSFNTTVTCAEIYVPWDNCGLPCIWSLSFLINCYPCFGPFCLPYDSTLGWIPSLASFITCMQQNHQIHLRCGTWLTPWWPPWQLSHSNSHTCELALVGLKSEIEMYRCLTAWDKTDALSTEICPARFWSLSFTFSLLLTFGYVILSLMSLYPCLWAAILIPHGVRATSWSV